MSCFIWRSHLALLNTPNLYVWLPDKITIFQGPLERDFHRDELEEQVKITVVHEIAHFFGFDEDRIKELGWG